MWQIILMCVWLYVWYEWRLIIVLLLVVTFNSSKTALETTSYDFTVLRNLGHFFKLIFMYLQYEYVWKLGIYICIGKFYYTSVILDPETVYLIYFTWQYWRLRGIIRNDFLYKHLFSPQLNYLSTNDLILLLY